MSPSLEEDLYNKHPSMLAGMMLGPEKSCMAFGVDCGDGWYPLVDYLLDALEEAGSVENLQIKEKYRSLRVYLGPAMDDHFDLVDAAEELSKEICEACGEPGKMNNGPWYSVRCDKCR